MGVRHLVGDVIADALWGAHYDELMLANMDADDEAR